MPESRLQKINNPDAKTLKVLVAPLDWGLGHATRCIPIIRELLNQSCTVIVAAGGAQKTIFQEEFPEISFVEIPGFRIKYGKNRASTLAKISLQIPKFLIGIKQENQWLRAFAGREVLDLVISDNRYGLYGSGLLSVFMTHQLAIKSSLGSVVNWSLQKINYAYIRRFSICWVPDMPGEDNLAGELSHPSRLPGTELRYIGWLSRLVPDFSGNPVETIDLLVLLSGPEPQRTMLEGIVLGQLTPEMGRIVLVRGLPNGKGHFHAPAGVVVYDYLNARELARSISQSKLVLARSGYSTVMDLVRMGKQAIYVPTPGQPEQEYLGRYLEKKGWGILARQNRFSLPAAIKKTSVLRSPMRASTNDSLAAEIERVLTMARSQSANPT